MAIALERCLGSAHWDTSDQGVAPKTVGVKPSINFIKTSMNEASEEFISIYVTD